jgi:HlyD family secretion protein
MTRSHAREIVIAATAVAGGVFLIWLFWPRPLDVDAADVRMGSISDTVADQGIARVRQSYVVSAPVSGRLERLPLEVGDRVVANETPVASIRPSTPELLDPRTRAQAETAEQAARAALASARAQRDRLSADADRARDQLQRTANLAAQGIVPPSDLVAAKADAEQAEHAVRGADADIRTRQANLASAQMALASPKAASAQVISVTSPASGLVTKLVQQSERTVATGTPLVEIGDTAGLEAAIEFLSQDAVKIRPGQRAEIYDWGGPETIPAEVRLVEPQGFTKVSALGVEEQRTLVILQFTAAPGAWAGLAPGYRVWGRVYLRELSSATLAPIGALVRDRGEWAVYRIENGRARLRTVQIGTMNDRDAAVLAGVDPGDRVIVYPSDEIRDGVRVRSVAAR